MTESHSSGVILWKIWSRRMPALLTTMSRRPKASSAVATMRCAAAHSATLPVSTTAWPPRCSMMARVCSPGVAEVSPRPLNEAPTSLTTTRAPASAMASAISRPMPPPLR